MPKRKAPDEDPVKQHERFKALARETGANRNAKAFDHAFERLAPPAKHA